MKMMIVIGLAALLLGLVIAVLLALADPVLLSRISEEAEERHLDAKGGVGLARLPRRHTGPTARAA